jgi:hypothetical protein
MLPFPTYTCFSSKGYPDRPPPPDPHRNTVQFSNQRCRPSVRKCNKKGVPDADFMPASTPQSHHLSPVKGEFEGGDGGWLIVYTLGFHHLQFRSAHNITAGAKVGGRTWYKLEG